MSQIAVPQRFELDLLRSDTLQSHNERLLLPPGWYKHRCPALFASNPGAPLLAADRRGVVEVLGVCAVDGVCWWLRRQQPLTAMTTTFVAV